MDVKMEVGIAGNVGYDDFIKKDSRSELKLQSQEFIKKGILDLVNKVQKQYKSDIFGFGNTVYRHMPDIWKTLEGDWEDVFSKLPVNVNVEVVIKGSGLTKVPIVMGD